MRVLRAGIAIWAFAEVWRTGEWMLFMLGSIFALQAIFDVGCCGAAGCATPQQRTYSNKAQQPTEDVEYEEIS